EHFVAHPGSLVKGFLELPGRCGGLRTQQAFFYNGREGPVFERNSVKTRLPPVEDISKSQLLCAWQVVANQLTQVPLTRNKTDNGNGPRGGHSLDQLGNFLALAVHKGEVSGLAGQPQDQLV